jgi:mono/diheme cytochrome c family protein
MKTLKSKVVGLMLLAALTGCNSSSDSKDNLATQFDPQTVFRYDTFGDEAFWTDVLKWNEVVTTISPVAALGVGLKVDSEAVPKETLDAVLASEALLNDPATTLALLKLDAVVGIKATVEDDGTVSKFGITCALCHSTVDDSVAKGIGKRLDGWPARDLNPGLIISLSPFFDDKPEKREAYASWGPGRFDDYFNQDGINAPVLITPAWGLKDVALETYTGEGPISFWNRYIAVTQMGGVGNFKSEHLGLDIQVEEDLVEAKLPALLAYQQTFLPPAPPVGSFNEAAAARGKVVFEGRGTCSSCHAGEFFTDAPKLHEPSETGSNPLHANRASTGKYRTTPLKGVWQHAPYFHDGAHATLADVVDHYDSSDVLNTNLSVDEKADLVEYLKSL